MAEVIKNRQGFKILKLDRDETRALNWGLRGGCVCSHCNCMIPKDEVYYIAVLNDTLRIKCYSEFIAEATSYNEDVPYEENLYKSIVQQLDSIKK